MGRIGQPRIAGTYAGAGVRWSPSERITTERDHNQQRLLNLFTPDNNPAQTIAERIKEGLYVSPFLFSALPLEEAVSYYGLKKPFLPVGSDSGYQWLKQRAESGRLPAIGEESRIIPAQREVSVREIDDLEGPGRILAGSYYLEPPAYSYMKDIPVVEINNGLQPYEKTSTLAHELGHHVLQHKGDRLGGRYGGRETEAETVAYGAVNRLFPWNKAHSQKAADYIMQVQKWSDQVAGANSAINPIDYLQDPNIQEVTNKAVQTLIPNPRKPFSTIVPDVYGGSAISSRNPNPVTRAYQQEVSQEEAMLNDRYARYGY